MNLTALACVTLFLRSASSCIRLERNPSQIFESFALGQLFWRQPRLWPIQDSSLGPEIAVFEAEPDATNDVLSFDLWSALCCSWFLKSDGLWQHCTSYFQFGLEIPRQRCSWCDKQEWRRCFARIDILLFRRKSFCKLCCILVAASYHGVWISILSEIHRSDWNWHFSAHLFEFVFWDISEPAHFPGRDSWLHIAWLHQGDNSCSITISLGLSSICNSCWWNHISFTALLVDHSWSLFSWRKVLVAINSSMAMLRSSGSLCSCSGLWPWCPSDSAGVAIHLGLCFLDQLLSHSSFALSSPPFASVWASTGSRMDSIAISFRQLEDWIFLALRQNIDWKKYSQRKYSNDLNLSAWAASGL